VACPAEPGGDVSPAVCPQGSDGQVAHAGHVQGAFLVRVRPEYGRKGPRGPPLIVRVVAVGRMALSEGARDEEALAAARARGTGMAVGGAD